MASGNSIDTALLPEAHLLAGASGALIALIEAWAKPLQLAKGETLFMQGDQGDKLYILRSGALQVSVLSSAGRQLTLNVLGEGAVFGEIALFDPGPRTATVTALERCDLSQIKRADLMVEIRSQPDLALEMMRLAGRRLRWVSTQLEDHVFLPLASRLARKLLYLSAQAGGSGQTVAMSQTDLAEHVAATREVVSKTLSEWKRHGLVNVLRGGIEIVDPEALMELSQTDFY